MDISALLTEIDSEINRREQARTALIALQSPSKRGPGRPKATSAKAPKKRAMSAEARARIAAAQKARWAAAKKPK